MTHLAFPGRETAPGHTRATEVTGLRSSAHPPIFLHCGWRTRGTWIWNRFREMRGVAGYYEPLAEILARLRPNSVATITAESWPSGHRGLARPYFDEYRPLLRASRNGVRSYRSRFATSDFFATPDAALPELEAWLRLLLNTARDRGEQPVLKFCRSLGRLGWMRQRFPDAVHIVVMRDPFTQFASAARQFVATGNAYFLATPLQLLALNRDVPLVALCARQLGVALSARTDCRTPEAALRACEAAVRGTTAEIWYRGFLAFWVTTAAALPDGIDLVIDSERLAGSDPYRLACEIELARLTGRLVDFSDTACAAGTRRPETARPARSSVLRAHAEAEAFLADAVSPEWADLPRLGFIADLLSEARSLGLGSRVSCPARSLTIAAPFEEDPEAAAALRFAQARAARAERELAAVWASRSWRLTAPLRRMRGVLG